MATQKEKQGDLSTHKEKLQSPKNVPCSICLDAVESAGDRSIARLKCGHHFHLDCIGSAFNAKGAMQCPNCRQIEGGQWLFSTGDCYQRSSNFDQDSNGYAGVRLNLLYRYDERLNHLGSRRPQVGYRELPMENDFLSSTNRIRIDFVPWDSPVSELGRPLTSDLDRLHAGGTYIHGSQNINMHRIPLHETILPTSQMLLDGRMSRQRMDEDELLHHGEPANVYESGHRYGTDRWVGGWEREIAYGLELLPESRLHGNTGSIEQFSASQIQDARYGPRASDAFSTGWSGAYPSRGHAWGSTRNSVQRVMTNTYNGEVHYLDSPNRAAGSRSYYNGHQLRARAPWL